MKIDTIICVIYVSSATMPMADDDLMALLEQSRRNNQEREITGLLLYSDSNFIQILEGPKEGVDWLLSRISQDPRHKGMIKLLEFESEQRNFPEWSMGFKRIERSELENIPGFNSVIEQKNIRREEFEQCANKVWLLLETFSRINL